jgi:tRNA A37 threonylcarbamoyladenosine synthetase subunit TsaC/SUA5/YrdC
MTETTPAQAGRDVDADAGRVLDALAAGGVAILPLDVAYAVIGAKAEAIRAIFAAKARSYDKPSGMFGSWTLSRELHVMPAEHHAIARIIVEQEKLPFSIVAPFHADHPLLNSADPFTLANSTKNGTLDMLINAGRWHDAVAAESVCRGMAVFGSSANRSLTGSKYRLADIEPEVRAIATVAIDGGESKYANPEGRSSTIIDFRDFSLVRRGVCVDRLEAAFQRHFGITLKNK